MFFQFDFKINLKELKDFLYKIQLYVEIPDYYAGTRMCNSVRLIIHEQGPKVDWEVVHETSRNYYSVLEFLLLPTGFFNYLKKFTLNCFITTPIFHVIKTETEGYMFFDSADDYYRYLDLL